MYASAYYKYFEDRFINILHTHDCMNSWGLSTSIDLYGCNPELIRDPIVVRDFMAKLVKVIDMVPYGPCIVERFGTGNKEGLSAVQLIETSCITAHFAEDSNSAYIDVFSCKDYLPDEAAMFAADFFDAADCIYVPLVRE